MKTSVLIVGAGPVGLTMAGELARYGVPLRVVDTSAHRTDKSKAIVIWSRTLELLDRGGGSRPFVDAGFKVHGANFLANDGEVVGHVSLDAVKSPYPYALMLPQSDTECLLEERLHTLGVAIERRTEVTNFASDVDRVEATLRRPDGSMETVTADWLVGCDGAHSIVRHTLGVPFTGVTMDSDWMLADAHMRGYPFPDTEVSVFWAKQGAFVIFPISPGRYRIIANVPVSGSEQPPAPTLEQVQTVIDQRGPKGLVAFDPIWLAGFRINARKVENYRSGRVFLTGDAAHVRSPAGGEGMNTGMQDSFNLAWKLALVVRGTCGAQLLDTYSPERSKIGDEVLKNTARLTAVGTLQSPIAQELRNLVGHIALGLSPVRHALTNTMSQISVGYSESPMNGPTLAGTAGPRPGERVEPVQGQPPIGAGDSPRFALLAEPTQETSDLLATFPKILEAEVRPPPDPRGLWLVRPDGYVAMAAAAGDGKAISDFLRRISH